MIKFEKHPVFNLWVSKCGLVQGPRGIRKTRFDRDGYSRLNVTINGLSKTVLVHKLVAETYLTTKYWGLTVNHKNGIKSDNRVENLEYISPAENVQHAFKIGLNKICKPIVIDGQHFYSQREAERKTGVKRYAMRGLQ